MHRTSTILVILFVGWARFAGWLCQAAEPPIASVHARLVEASGTVELFRSGMGWRAGVPGEALVPSDVVRTGLRSRAAVQLGDRTVVRLDQSTLFQILPARQERARRRFRLDLGRVFLLNRERAEEVEFETPVAVGAIRGTEFVLSVPDRAGTDLELIDGEVILSQGDETVVARGSEAIRLRVGESPRREAILAVVRVQWALYYPSVVDPRSIELPPAAIPERAAALEAYRQGDVLGALQRLPQVPDSDDPSRVLRSAAYLAVGRVDEARASLDAAGDSAGVRALRSLIRSVTGEGVPGVEPPASSSEWLAESYRLQSVADWDGALGAARKAVELSSEFGVGYLRIAELEFALERLRAADRALERGRSLVPRHPLGPAMAGWMALERNRPELALVAFDDALYRDGGFGDAWLGRGLALEALKRGLEASASFQAAAALEPSRSVARSYLAKSWAARGEPERGLKEVGRAEALDTSDPTPWFYSALIRRQQREFNDAVADLERSLELNDQRAVLRPRLGLDRDRAMRSADLAGIYQEVGLEEAAEASASRAVTEDYSNFAAHLFLARSIAAREDPARFDLRYETPRQNELLLANLLAPPGAGNLSPQFALQSRLRYFVPPRAGLASETTYLSRGAWNQSAAVFGSLERLDYAVDAAYRSDPGWRPNQDLERRQFILSAKQALSTEDSAYLQTVWTASESGDVARYLDPSQSNPSLRVRVEQSPQMLLGWHHRWAPGSHTLVLGSFAADRLDLADPERRLLFVRQREGTVAEVEFDRARVDLDLQSRFQLGGVEVQQIWQTEELRILAGARYLRGALRSRARLGQPLDPRWLEQEAAHDPELGSAYVLVQRELLEAIRLDAGIGHAFLGHPRNVDLPPFSGEDDRSEAFTPRIGLTIRPGPRALVQAAYGRSLGGLFFDQSLRLEPARLAGFNQTLRSVIPESLSGLVPGTVSDAVGVRWDRSFGHGTYVGAAFESLVSRGEREVGAVANSLPFPVPDTPTSTLELLDYREHRVSVYLQQLVASHLSFGARFQVSMAELETRLPEFPEGTPGLSLIERDVRGTLPEVELSARWQHHRGWMAVWESTWRGPTLGNVARPNAREFGASGGTRDLSSDPGHADGFQRDVDSFWSHSLAVGYRWPRQAAEVLFGIENLTGDPQRLHPLHLAPALPPERTFFVRLGLNF